MAKARRTTLAILAALVAAILALGGVASAQQQGTTTSPSPTAPPEGQAEQLRVENPGTGDSSSLSQAQRQALSRGYLVPDEEAYERAKAEAAERAERLSAEDAPAPPEATAAPRTFRSWEGIRDRRASPSDSTGAIGPTRYIELINVKYAIYGRAGGAPIDTGDLNELAGTPPLPEVDVFDPQIIWDPTTRRFYYVADTVYGETDTRLAFGFSKTANPSSAADFCKYSIRFGTRFPDYPKLGGTEDLLLVGVNSFDFETFEFLGSDLVSITKPSAGSGCPPRSAFTVDIERELEAGDGSPALTPVPANQIDTSGAGYVVAIPFAIYDDFFAQHIAVFRATEGRGGTLRLSGPSRLRVPTYWFPPQAPQPGTNYRLDTLDGRMTQAVLARDPARGGKRALWTQHTVQGGSGTEVRWYETDPAAPARLQSGRVSGEEPGDYTFNAAISPDRQVNGDTERFGSNMVLGFNTSSVAHPPDIRMVSKVGDEPISEQVIVKASPTSLTDWSCFRSLRFCRWGDYSAAAPDPLVPETATSGRVWLTNQWVKARGEPDTLPATWGTWNWAASP